MSVRRSLASAASALLAAALLTTGCAGGGDTDSKPASPSPAAFHGHVEGATEAGAAHVRRGGGGPQRRPHRGKTITGSQNK
ncbi:hypothetical protein ACISU4_34010, partial [Streptomyces wuyuanensis]